MSDDFLTKSEFYEYMGDFRVALENRLTKLEKKMENGKNGCNSKNRDVWPFVKYIIGALIGAVLVLAGANAGKIF